MIKALPLVMHRIGAHNSSGDAMPRPLSHASPAIEGMNALPAVQGGRLCAAQTAVVPRVCRLGQGKDGLGVSAAPRMFCVGSSRSAV